MRTVFVNGEYCLENAARVSVFDRGFLFSDGVYEVTSVIEGRLVDNPRHLQRLHRSLEALAMPCPMPDADIHAMQEQLVARNSLQEGLVYLQVTRGAADRDFVYPQQVKPSVVAFTQAKSILQNPKAETGLRVISVPDIRWQRRDIKTIGLLAPSMAKQQAILAGVDDAWMVDEAGLITEGSSNNCYILTADDIILTRPLSRDILHGITRRALLQVAAELNLEVTERAFSVAEAQRAKEAFISSAATFCLPVTQVDGRQIGDGKPGPVYRRLRDAYIEFARESIRG